MCRYVQLELELRQSDDKAQVAGGGGGCAVNDTVALGWWWCDGDDGNTMIMLDDALTHAHSAKRHQPAGRSRAAPRP